MCLQKEMRTVTLQAKAENMSEREAQRGDGDGACNCPISQEAVLRLESMRFFQVHCNHPSEMIPGLDISWEWIGKPQAFKAYVRFAAGSQQGRGKCHVGAQPAVYEKRRKSSRFICYQCWTVSWKLKAGPPWQQNFRGLGWKVRCSEAVGYSLSSKFYKERDILQSRFPYWKLKKKK